jgi:hypothetical protein
VLQLVSKVTMSPTYYYCTDIATSNIYINSIYLSCHVLQVRIAREFVPPGEIIWLERYKVVKQRLRPPAAAAADTQAGTEPRSVPNSSSNADVQRDASGNTMPAGAEAAAAAAAGHEAQAALSSSTAAAAANMLRAGSRGIAAALAAAPSAVASKRTALYLRPHFTDGLSLIVGGMVVSRNMFLDHVPDNQLAQLKRLVRRLKQQQAVRIGLGAGAAAEGAAVGSSQRRVGSASADVPPRQQVMPERQHVVHFAV